MDFLKFFDDKTNSEQPSILKGSSKALHWEETK